LGILDRYNESQGGRQSERKEGIATLGPEKRIDNGRVEKNGE
jgi:hypothetical protein